MTLVNQAPDRPVDRAVPPAIQLTGIEKSFGGVRALRGVDLTVRRGEIMGLCGENGAGKSTLIKILAGVYPHGSYRGTVTVSGVERALRSPADGQRAGIAVVHQELMLVPELSVAQNLFLGREPRRFGFVDEARLELQAARELASYGFAGLLSPSSIVADLGVGLQQIVEIIRALAQRAAVLVLDEPTAALTGHETASLLAWLRQLREHGTTCIYISHRLNEVFAVCDRVSVLRDGRHVRTFETSAVSPGDIVSAMVGRNVERVSLPTTTRPTGHALLELREFSVHRDEDIGAPTNVHERHPVVEALSLSVAAGEIVAVCGAMGSGRTALLSALFGCARAGTAGTMRLAGHVGTPCSPRHAIELGIALVPEDRRQLGLVTSMTVAENLALPSLASREAMGSEARLGLVDPGREAILAQRQIAALGIRGDAEALVSTLSGGNQQKVALGKWLERSPRLLLLDEPTRGVDVGAREEIYALLERLAQQGVAVLFASSDLVEVLRLAQRVLVLRQGRLAGQLPAHMATERAIVELSTGARLEEPPE